jgi:hypothetical protein
MKLNFRESHRGRVECYLHVFHSTLSVLFYLACPRQPANLYYVLQRAKLADVNGNAAAARARVKPRPYL